MTYFSQAIRNYIPREEGRALAMSAINKAISFGPDIGTVWGTYGLLKKDFDWDWDAAQTALTRADQLDPNSSDIKMWRASLDGTLEYMEQAIELYQQVLVVDPLNMTANSSIGILYRKIGQFDNSIAFFEKQIELRPQYHWAYFNLGKSYLSKGDAAQALVEIEQNPANFYREIGLIMAYSTLKREAEAQAILQQLVARESELSAAWIAETFAWRGENDQAFEWLEKAYVKKDLGLVYILGKRVFESLWDDPRWAELLKKLNLLEHWQDMPPAYGGSTKPAS